MHKPIKYVEKGLTVAAKGAWAAFDTLNSIKPNAAFTPKWSDSAAEVLAEGEAAARLAARDRFALPDLRARGAPGDRRRQAGLQDPAQREGRRDQGAPSSRRDGKILMVKDCPIHGHFEDVMAMDPAFFKHLEDVVPGQRHPLAQRREAPQPRQQHHQVRPRLGPDDRPDQPLQHDVRPVLHGRQPGRLRPRALVGRDQDDARQRHHDQAEAPDVGAVLGRRADDVAVLPRRGALREEGRLQLGAGGDQRHRVREEHGVRARRRSRRACATPTCSSTASATPPTRTAWSATCSTSSCARSRTSGRAGVDIVPVITIVNGVNNEQVGRVVQFALDNPKKINFLSFQPVSFTGRDEEVTPERRAAQRYTLSHLAHDVKNQTGLGEPIRDWFPISFMGTFTDWADLVHGPTSEWGNLTCGCHPNCGIGMAVMIDKETKEAVPVTAFLNAEQLAKDLRQVNDAARGRGPLGARAWRWR